MGILAEITLNMALRRNLASQAENAKSVGIGQTEDARGFFVAAAMSLYGPEFNSPISVFPHFAAHVYGIPHRGENPTSGALAP